jgi:hypothetical protein
MEIPPKINADFRQPMPTNHEVGDHRIESAVRPQKLVRRPRSMKDATHQNGHEPKETQAEIE